MSEIMKDEEFLKTITKEELLENWGKEQERRKIADDRIRHLEKEINSLKGECEKYRKWWRESLKNKQDLK